MSDIDPYVLMCVSVVIVLMLLKEVWDRLDFLCVCRWLHEDCADDQVLNQQEKNTFFSFIISMLCLIITC